MVAIFVVLTIIVFLLIDYVVQKIQAGKLPVAPGRKGDSEAHTVSVPLSPDSLTVPASLFFHRGHTWIKFNSPTLARVGLDDFSQKILGRIETIQFPRVGERVRQGEPLMMVRVGSHKLFLPAPSDGIITHVNTDLAAHPEILHASPFEAGWICEMRPENISLSIRELLSGDEAVRWELHEMNKLAQFITRNAGSRPAIPVAEFSLGKSWADEEHSRVMKEFSRAFFALDMERAQLLTEVS